MPKKIQTSLTGGELDPRLYSRVDISKYQSGARLLSNWLIHPYGGASNRPGFEFITFNNEEQAPTRLATFDAGDGDSYILQFSSGFIAFIRQGAPIVRPDGSRYVIPSPYTGLQVFELKILQSNDVLTITHPNHPPRTLSRFDNADWRMVDLSFMETVPAPNAITVVPVTRPVQSGEYQWPVDETYVITNVDASTGRESLPSDPVFCLIDLSLRGFYVVLEWPRTSPGILRSNVYKRKGGVYGLVGQGNIVRNDGGTDIYHFEDRNISPDMTQGIQLGGVPFSTPDEYPTCATYFQQRRVFAGMRGKPNRTRASQSSDYENFNTSFPSRDSDALDFSIAQEKRQDIKHMVSGQDLILFTTSGEWRVRGAQEGLLAPSSIDARLQSQYGCLPDVPPVLVNDDIVFVQAKGQTVRSISFNFAENKYKGEPLNLLAQHLFEGKQVRQMAYAQVPFSILYCAMGDGTLLAFTYLRDQEVFAWSRIETPGIVESISTAPEGLEDVLYISVLRGLGSGTRRMVERMASRRMDSAADAFFVDCGLRRDDPRAITGIQQISDAPIRVFIGSHSIMAGATVDIDGVTALFAFNDDGDPIPVGMVGARQEDPTINAQWLVSAVGSDWIELAYADAYGGAVLTKGSEFGPYVGGGVVRVASRSVTGLSHLEGMDVSGTANGAVIGTLRVKDGAVTLPSPASRVSIGLGYASDLQTLDLDIGQVSINGEPKNITNVIVKVDKTRGLYVGQDRGGVIYEMDPRGEKGGEDYGQTTSLWTGQFKASFPGDWNTNGRLYLRAQFLPCTVLAIVPAFEAGGTELDGQG